MTPQEKIKAAFALLKKVFEDAGKEVKKFLDVTTSDNKTLTINDPDGDGVPAVGDTVMEGATPAADGDYQLTDGTIITIVGGAITSVAGDDTMPDMSKMAATVKEALAKIVTDATEKFNAFKKETNDSIEKFTKELKEAKEANATIIEAHNATNKELKEAKTELAAQKLLIEETFKVVELLSEMPEEKGNPDESVRAKMAKERKTIKDNALTNLLKLRNEKFKTTK